MILVGIVAGAVGSLLVIGGATAAYRDHFFFVRHVKAREPAEGFPYVAHGGMYSDLFLLSPVLGIIVALYGVEWPATAWAAATVAGIAASLALHYFLYLKGPLSTFLEKSRGVTSASGWFHIAFTAYALAILALFYFATAHVNPAVDIAVSALLAFHVLASQLGQVFAYAYGSEWFPANPFENKKMMILVVLVWIFIAWRCWALLPS